MILINQIKTKIQTDNSLGFGNCIIVGDTDKIKFSVKD